MENEINLQVKRDDSIVAANKRSDTYALKRNLQALEFNEAIITRQQAEAKNQIKCEKCGRIVMMERALFDRRLKKVVQRKEEVSDHA